ncbi:MAG: peptidase U32 [Alphaproteobacteria bacterium RIFCSPLOWO2_01_FULL_40_26]|nr:MAG: peptidase U32 [Alphaproteobacteria bacterium RIFCSPHIGHO2_02_FULL_40_34]OFW86312.1 MAG: peptidase U32 [Alphaproteobacteria bacterium RIFCSPHIGHO2_01_FULL_40_8]OFW95169.1 MAG: peptidase U32 [Alphaproteobacteria bacterium RIFCSPLOWO2_01_FULL_40_26]OFX09119.1 MAG: peptidase U32 [Alphaproteobacteria bacterium RIFCSPLOWO2_02_FULL_40_19]OFX11496.1 MAG: peptidase U32 [Alphaproteobacteria bacterium RIFCSPLOWO2_12_FULL_40_11]
MKKPELLLPAGNLDRLKTAILYGADAVYLGTPDMSLRVKSGFTLEDVVEGVKFAHEHGKKVYLTLNLFSHNKDIEKLSQFVETVQAVKPDGLIISDPGVFNFVKKQAPELELHISTQANVCSWLTVNFWKEQGAKLVVMAREVSFEELAEIRKKCPDIKLETFIHGSMCMTYSGRCLLSNFMAERGANQGSCAHSCRWGYKLKIKLKDNSEHEIEINENNKDLFDFFLEEEMRPGELMPFEEDVHGSYILNSKDLCLLPKLDEYIKLGLDSFKVEGRNKTEFYAGSVARVYRVAIDDYMRDPQNWCADDYMDEINAIANRGYSLAFHDGRLTNLAHDYESTGSTSFYEYAARIIEWNGDDIICEGKNRLDAGDVLEFLSPYQRQPVLLRIYEFKHVNDGKITDKLHAGQKPLFRIPASDFHTIDKERLQQLLPPFSLVRKEKMNVESEKLKVESRQLSHQLEAGCVREEKYENKRKKYFSALEIDDEKISPKTPRIGKEGCCGKGCNGCLIFWHDEKYAKAREILKTKKIGEML